MTWETPFWVVLGAWSLAQASHLMEYWRRKRLERLLEGQARLMEDAVRRYVELATAKQMECAPAASDISGSCTAT